MLNRLTLGIATAALVAAGSALAQTQQQGGGSAAGRMMQQGGGQGMPMMQGEGRPGMMQGRGMMDNRMGHGGMGPHMMLMMMALIDTDGSESLSLEEVQAVHARMFSYADADDDGELTLEELRAFMHGGVMPAVQ